MMKTGLSACLLGLALWVAPNSARANDFAGCFREGKSFAICNGIVAGIAGLGSVGLGTTSLLARPEDEEVGYIAGGVAAGMYSAVSGAALLAMADSLEPDDPLIVTSRVVGWLDLTAGGLGLAMTAVAGVKLAITDTEHDDDDDVALFLAPGVPGFTNAGVTVTLSF